MATARCVLILTALVTNSAPLRAQQAPGRADNGVVPSPSDAPVAAPRPKPGKQLLDLLQTMIKPSEQPAPPQTVSIDPKSGTVPPDPVVVPPPVSVVTPTPLPVATKPDPVRPLPVALKADPVRPSAPRPLPREAVSPSPPDPPALVAPTLPPAVAVVAPPPPPITASADDPPVEERNAIAWLWLAVALVTALAGGGAIHLRRVRRLARTKAALSLAPRIDFSGGRAPPPGLALTRPAVAIRARLEERAHG